MYPVKLVDVAQVPRATTQRPCPKFNLWPRLPQDILAPAVNCYTRSPRPPPPLGEQCPPRAPGLLLRSEAGCFATRLSILSRNRKRWTSRPAPGWPSSAARSNMRKAWSLSPHTCRRCCCLALSVTSKRSLLMLRPSSESFPPCRPRGWQSTLVSPSPPSPRGCSPSSCRRLGRACSFSAFPAAREAVAVARVPCLVARLGGVERRSGRCEDRDDEAPCRGSGMSNPAAEAIADTGSPRSRRSAALNAPSADLRGKSGLSVMVDYACFGNSKKGGCRRLHCRFG